MKKAAWLVMISLWSSVAYSQGNDNQLLLTLYDQLEALQQEVQNLRGMVETQSNQIRRLETESRDRYMDLDRRLAEQAVSVTTTGMPAPAAPMAPIAQPTTTAPPQAQQTLAATQSNQLSEQELYRTALNTLLDAGDSSTSVELFQAYIDRYPAGGLLPNALYWQGEALILLARHPQAIAAFDRVVREFPQDPKAAGSMLKMGVAHDLMGDRARAEQTWRDLLTQFPESTSELTLAREYLNQRR